MKKFVTTPGACRLTVLAALLAGCALPALAVSPNLVISQVYGAGGNAGTTLYRHDYIEIFNRGSVPITATGWTVQYGSASSTAAWSGKSTLPTFTIQPGQYLLIQQQSGSTTGTQPLLPDPAIIPVGQFNMSGTAGKVALVKDGVTLTGATPSTANVVDMVGFGTANGFEGSVAPAPGNTLAIFRAAGGCTDTDVNGSDFVTGAPAPRTSASPLAACGGPALPQPLVATCPALLSAEKGVGGKLILSASDADSVITGASITTPTTGLSLGSLVASSDGKSATIELIASAALADGSRPVTIKFSNDAAQEATCTVNVATVAQRTIPQIQGTSVLSPFDNTVQITTGVVTNIVTNGYFIQDPDGDGDPTSSDGMFVFTSTAPTVALGDLVKVTGTITEFKPSGAARSMTEMKDVTATAVLATGRTITPTNIAFSTAADLPRFEGMLVNIVNGLTVNQTNYLGSRGELSLAVGRRETPTNRHRPGSAEALGLQASNANNLLVLDDGIFTTPVTLPYLGDNGTVRAGDTATNLVGVIDYGSIGGGGAAFKLQPTATPVISRTNLRTAAPELPAGNLRIASSNVLNFFTTFLDGRDAFGNTGQGCTVGTSTRASNCRGADNTAEFVRQRDKIIKALAGMNADVVGLMEIQNNGDVAVAYLVEQLNLAMGAGTYAYVPKPADTGTDAIRVAMIYKPAKVSLVGAALSDGDAVNNRPPMAQTFKAANGAKFSVIVNHLKSKASCGSGLDADQGDGQSCNNASRVAQAQRLASHFVPQVVAAAGDPDVLLIGDFNAHGFEDPIHLLNEAGFVNELERLVRPHTIPYSYVFNGEAGYLDHALASASLSEQIIGATEWHLSADEPEVLDYNMDGKSAAVAALYASDAFRSSDHDPVVIALQLASSTDDVTSLFVVQRSGLNLNAATGMYSGRLTLTVTSGKALSGPFHVMFNNLPSGITLANASGTANGAPYISLSGSAIAAGASISVPVEFSDPNRTGIRFSNAVLKGSF